MKKIAAFACYTAILVSALTGCKKDAVLSHIDNNAIDNSVLANALTITLSSVPVYYTPLLDTVFIAGTFNNWNPRDTAYRLKKNKAGKWQITLSQPAGTSIEYKFTRGGWPAVETKTNGSFQPNRLYTFTTTTANKSIAIGNWQDVLGNHTAVGNTRIIDMDMFMPQLNRYRRIWIYLPQDYNTGNKSYPTLYMQDGQNLFDASTSAFGEWKCDETMEDLQAKDSTDGIIIIGIDNGGLSRINEYSPWVNAQYGGGEGDEYMDFIIQTLKPFIDSHFRTLPTRENTGIMGSSMGGLISWYGGLLHQDIFSKVGVFSPSFWFSPSVMTTAANTPKTYPTSFYFLAGGGEGAETDANIKKVRTRMKANGFTTQELKYTLVPNGEHSEWFWAEYFDDAVLWLY